MNKKLLLLLSSCLLTLLCACSSHKEVAYFQNSPIGVEFETVKAQNITFKEGDMLSIIVSSRNPELAIEFNLPEVTQRLGSSGYSAPGNRYILGYTVTSRGNIELPVLGSIHIKGMTKEQLADYIKSRLLKEELLKNPVVIINFLNLQFFILGDVAKPGEYKINKDKLSILEAISMAGDLNITGKRDNVMLTRANGDKRINYLVDLRSQSIYQSPAFYVQQNDILYIEPNRRKANEANLNANLISSPTFWVSIATFFTAFTVLLTDN